jgi:CRISPR/Cas system CMR subunit Cmr4 (Cas7 group RAMP superfamily)
MLEVEDVLIPTTAKVPVEDVVRLLIPIMAISIPLVIVTGRFVIQPIVQALSRLSEQQGGSKDIGRLEQRMAHTEERLEGIERALNRLAEAQDFHRQLRAAPPAGAAPEDVFSRGEERR